MIFVCVCVEEKRRGGRGKRGRGRRGAAQVEVEIRERGKKREKEKKKIIGSRSSLSLFLPSPAIDRMSLIRLRSVLPPALLQTLRSQSIRAMGIGGSFYRLSKRKREKWSRVQAQRKRRRHERGLDLLCYSPCRALSRPRVFSSQRQRKNKKKRKTRLSRLRQRPGENRQGPGPGRRGPRPLSRAHGAPLVRGPGLGLSKKQEREEREREREKRKEEKEREREREREGAPPEEI